MKRTLFYLLGLPLCLAFISGCAIRDASPQATLRKHAIHDLPQPAYFEVCSGFGCTHTALSALSLKEWQEVHALFIPRPETAEEERKVVAKAIALLERQVGTKIGTTVDVAQNKRAGKGQLDCVAESVNTSVYLLMMEERALLNHHRVGVPEHRGAFIFYPHNTAVLEEKYSSKVFAVDSWFRPNGEHADIVLLQHWKNGWRPKLDIKTSSSIENEHPAQEDEHGI